MAAGDSIAEIETDKVIIIPLMFHLLTLFNAWFGQHIAFFSTSQT